MSDDYQVRKDIDRLISTVWETGSDQLLLTTNEEFEEYKEEVSNKYYDTSQISDILDNYSLKSDVYDKSDMNHWVEIDLGDYITCRVNEAMRICIFKYYRTGYTFDTTSSFVLEEDVLIEEHRPPFFTIVASCFNPHQGAVIDVNGDIVVWSTITGTANINFNAMWYY